MYLEVDVIFTPKTNEYQQDAIRIHSQVIFINSLKSFIMFISTNFIDWLIGIWNLILEILTRGDFSSISRQSFTLWRGPFLSRRLNNDFGFFFNESQGRMDRLLNFFQYITNIKSNVLFFSHYFFLFYRLHRIL